MQPSELLPPVENTTLKGKLVREGLKHTGLPESMIKRYWDRNQIQWLDDTEILVKNEGNQPCLPMEVSQPLPAKNPLTQRIPFIGAGTRKSDLTSEILH